MKSCYSLAFLSIETSRDALQVAPKAWAVLRGSPKPWLRNKISKEVSLSAFELHNKPQTHHVVAKGC